MVIITSMLLTTVLVQSTDFRTRRLLVVTLSIYFQCMFMDLFVVCVFNEQILVLILDLVAEVSVLSCS